MSLFIRPNCQKMGESEIMKKGNHKGRREGWADGV
jgi:hypothetical protein